MERTDPPNRALQRTSSVCHVRCDMPAEPTGSGRATLQPSLSLGALGADRLPCNTRGNIDLFGPRHYVINEATATANDLRFIWLTILHSASLVVSLAFTPHFALLLLCIL
jgi:hypothetical protein